jgi:hypothetical protein
MSNTWDSAGTVWDGAEWQAGTPPAPDFSKEWRCWYQVGSTATGNPLIDLNPYLVEARWSTDSHTMGDGTFRGDLQPGTATIRFWDPGHHLDYLPQNGCVFLLYMPTGACWCFFYASQARGLYAPGDPLDADTVLTATTWPVRLTNDQGSATFPAQAASARLGAVVDALNTVNFGLQLPAVGKAIAAQNQQVPATVPTSVVSNIYSYPGYLAVVRNAAADGVAWLQPSGAATGVGTLTLNYARWETINARVLDRSQVIAGPAVTLDSGYAVTRVDWAAVDNSAVATELLIRGGNWGSHGMQGPSGMRVLGNVGQSPNGPEYAACNQTATQLCSDRSDGGAHVLDSIDVQSGVHRTKAGGLSPTPWDPYSHHFTPVDVVSLVDNTGNTTRYRVTTSAHRLTATIWQTTHTLEKFTAPTPLP